MKKALGYMLLGVLIVVGSLYVLDREDVYSVSDLFATEETEQTEPIENGDDTSE